MKVLVNRYWNRIEVCYNNKAIIVRDIIYPIYRDYYIEHIKDFKEDSTSLVILEGEQDEYILFSGVNGEYIYLETYIDENKIKLWGTDGKRNDLGCYAEFKDDNWNIELL